MKYTRYNKFNLINVWAENEQREKIIKHKMLTDKSFKLSSLQVNPLYKPVFDKLDAEALKVLTELDNSKLWSRRYTKNEFRHFFVYPLFIFGCILFYLINYGVKYRLYYQHIKHGRHLGLSDIMDIDLDDIESYPKAVFEYYKENKLYKEHIKRKEEKIKKVEDSFHKFANTRMVDVAKARKRRGLEVKGINVDKLVVKKKSKPAENSSE